jgi:hypothetical protein
MLRVVDLLVVIFLICQETKAITAACCQHPRCTNCAWNTRTRSFPRSSSTSTRDSLP